MTEWTKERSQELRDHIELEFAFNNTKTVSLLTDALAEIERLQDLVKELEKDNADLSGDLGWKGGL